MFFFFSPRKTEFPIYLQTFVARMGNKVTLCSLPVLRVPRRRHKQATPQRNVSWMLFPWLL